MSLRSKRFLCQLRTLCDECPDDVGFWNNEGSRFEVIDEEKFNVLLKHFYPSSTPRTFFRQLAYYGFVCISAKREGGIPGSFSFRNKYFLRDRPELMDLIQRKNPQTKIPKKEDPPPATNNQLELLQAMVEDLNKKLSLLHLQHSETRRQLMNLQASLEEQKDIIFQ